MTHHRILIPGERALGWNKVLRMHWTKRQALVDALWLRMREINGYEWQTLDYRVDVEVFATFKGQGLDPDNVCAKLYIDAIKSKKLEDGTIEERILHEDDSRWIRSVTTESVRGKHNSIEIILTEATA